MYNPFLVVNRSEVIEFRFIEFRFIEFRFIAFRFIAAVVVNLLNDEIGGLFDDFGGWWWRIRLT